MGDTIYVYNEKLGCLEEIDSDRFFPTDGGYKMTFWEIVTARIYEFFTLQNLTNLMCTWYIKIYDWCLGDSNE